MDGIYFLNKSLDGLYYLDDKDDDAGYDLMMLSSNNPGFKFVVKNDSNTFGLPNVYTKKTIMKACGMDEKLQVKCPKCQTKNKYTRSMCRTCRNKIPHHDVLVRAIGENYLKALAITMVENNFGTQSTKRFAKAFEPYETSQASDPFLQLLNHAFFRPSE